MNITDYLVEYLKSGKAVSIPNAGVLTTKDVEAHFDKATGTFYPSRRTIHIEPIWSDNSDFMQFLADKECVGKSIAEKIWKNYTDALADKMNTEGRCRMGDLGCLTLADGNYGFEAADNLNLKSTAQKLEPVSGIRNYNSADTTDPFDAFEQPLKEGEVVSATMMTGYTPKPVSKPTPEPEPVAESEPEQELVPEPEPELVQEPEPVAEPEPIAEPEPEIVDEPVVEPESEPDAEPDPEPESEPTPAPEPVKAFDDEETISTLHQLDAIDESDGSMEEETRKKRKEKKEKQEREERKGGFWKALIWILAILIILLACAFVIDKYLFNSKGRDWAMQQINCEKPSSRQADIQELVDLTIPTDYDKEAARDNMTEYTMSYEGLQFDEDEIVSVVNDDVDKLRPYFKDYLKSMKQSDKNDDFVEQAAKYADQRLRELLTDEEFHFQSLLNYKDYVREYMTSTLKDIQVKRKMVILNRDLMSTETLERLLGEIVPADELTPDPSQMTKDEPAKPTEKKKADKPAPITSKVMTESKQGFDLIAGASVYKANADQLCKALKAKGCDAYIINRNGLYYVSMGSAASRTEIDAKYDHVKEWYKGDVTIKKW